MTLIPAIKDIGDTGKARMMMFANGQPVHAPLNALTASAIHLATAKATPVDADEFGYRDSVTGNPVKATWANIKATLKTYFDTLYQPLAAALTSWAAITRASGFDTFVATPSSANLRALLTDETGTGAAVFAGAPTITGVAVFSGVPSLTGGAITFPATQIASAGANDLDDYEEGTWTPGAAFGGGTTGITYSQRVGTYTKIGRLVHAVGHFNFSNKGSSTGAATFTGLPFTSSASQFSSGFISYFSSTSGINSQVTIHGGASATTVQPLFIQATGIAALTDANFTNTSDVIFSVIYTV